MFGLFTGHRRRTIYDRFVDRLVEAARSLAIGPAENPAYFMGPVVDGAAYKNVVAYIELAKQEGTLLLSRDAPDTGYYVPLTIVGDITPQHRIAQEEVFGPVLAVMKVKDFDQAIDWANSTRFALTGAVFSRSPEHLDTARQQFNVGNLYLNRGSTGALVERQPFGGFQDVRGSVRKRADRITCCSSWILDSSRKTPCAGALRRSGRRRLDRLIHSSHGRAGLNNRPRSPIGTETGFGPAWCRPVRSR
jgi:hypothetical protein